MVVWGLSGVELFGIFAGLASIVALAVSLVPRFRAWASAGPLDGQARTAAAIVYRGREVLMVKRRGIGEPLTWYFPSGSVNGGEDPVLRAIAEVKDETGVECRYEKKLGEREHPDTKVYMFYFACSYLSGDAANLDSDENSTVEWVQANEVAGRVKTDIFPPVKDFLGSL